MKTEGGNSRGGKYRKKKRKGGGKEGQRRGRVCIDNQSPKKNTGGTNDSGDPDMESHLSEHIDLIYKTFASNAKQMAWA